MQTTIKVLNTDAAKNNMQAFQEMCKLIRRNQLEVSKFITEHNLASQFILACESLKLIRRPERGKYLITYNGACDIMIGKIICMEINRIEQNNKKKFKILNQN